MKTHFMGSHRSTSAIQEHVKTCTILDEPEKIKPNWSVLTNQPSVIISSYDTALLSAGERYVHLHGPSRLSVLNNFSIMTVAKHIMTLSRNFFFFNVFRITLQVVL